MAKPALEEARRRCKDLEYRLVSRVRELSDETERVRRLQLEAEVAKSRLAAVEGNLAQGANLVVLNPLASLDGLQV